MTPASGHVGAVLSLNPGSALQSGHDWRMWIYSRLLGGHHLAQCARSSRPACSKRASCTPAVVATGLFKTGCLILQGMRLAMYLRLRFTS